MTCETCGHLFRVPLDAAGSQVYCPNCNEIVDVPSVLVETPEVEEVDPIVAPEFQFEDPDETADDVVERGGVRHLSREERAQSRARKNAIMLIVGFMMLFGAIFVLQANERFFMDLWEKYGAPPPEEKAGE
ncbi:MAG: hypothetical protein MI757_05755 [Pirellulales bacterium]|nr:hypothetical protein [Pirellulales bacterium]